MDIKITKGDVVWSYIAQFFQVASGILILPYILHKLPADEIGLNYLMLTIGSMVALLDFGFTPQFARNISYIYGGAQELCKEGVSIAEGNNINYRLLATMIGVAKKVYRYLSLLVLLVMLTVGSAYMYYITNGFSSVRNSFVIWIIYSFSTYFNIYYSYYNSLLVGSGKIMESKYAVIASRLVYIVLSIGFVATGWSLMGLCLANLIAPFFQRYISYSYYFTKDLQVKIAEVTPAPSEINNLFGIIWFNAKKLGINFLGSYAINKMGMFVAGLYLTLQEIASYGLMVQLVTLIGTVSMMLFTTMGPKFSVYRVRHNETKLVQMFSMSMIVFFILFITSCIALIIFGPLLLAKIGSNSVLPTTCSLVLYCLVVMLEQNHSAFATIIVTGNDVPFVKAALLSGFVIVLLSFVSLQWLNAGILGLVISQGICQLAYNNWKWPKFVLDKMNMSYVKFLVVGVKTTCNYCSSIAKRRI